MKNIKHKKKVIFLTPTMAIGGMQKIFMNLANSLADNFNIKILIARKDDNLSFNELINKRISIKNINCSRLRYSFLKINKYLIKEKPDSLVLASPIFVFIVSLFKIFINKNTNIFLTIHNDLIYLFKRLNPLTYFVNLVYLRIAIYFSNKVILPSHISRNFLRSKFPNRWNDIITISNPVFSNKNFYPYCDLKNDKIKIISCIGRLTAEKNYKLAINAFAEIHKQINAKLYIVGEGPDLKLLKKLVIELSLSEKIIFKVFVLDLKNIIINSDLILSTSNEESFGNTVLEALSNNVPIVTTNTNGPTEILEYIDPELISKNNTPVSIASSVIRALEVYKPNSIEKMNLNKKIDHFSQDFLIKEYINILSENK